MAKFFKSFFNTGDRRKGTHDEEDERSTDSPPPMDGKRQLSISRSGRMRQANKKRHSLTLDLYGDTNHIDAAQKPKSVEYHVHISANQTAHVPLNSNENRFDIGPGAEIRTEKKVDSENEFNESLKKKLSALALESGAKSPEEEIDNAFEIIDKS